jgi:competence protein ComEA
MPATRTFWMAVSGIVLAMAIVMLVLTLLRLNDDETLITIAPLPTAQAQTVTVFVGGAVVNPGVYTLPRGERIEGAIAAAGGFSPDANHDGINRAQLLRDEAQVVVPRTGEPTATPARSVTAAPTLVATPGSAAPRASAARSGPIDVNTATAAELERLPGVGTKIAQEIVTYRDAHGPFAGAADLAEVSGISERMVAEWEGLITFGP